MASVPYLGSKISLVSKSEIRYEGILYTIDTKESTVALAKVRSYGTEDRPTDRPVAPRDETYEYIIFRGADIKDIRVCQPPKPQPTLEGGLPNDPAIVQHSGGPPVGGAFPGGQHGAQPAPGAMGRAAPTAGPAGTSAVGGGGAKAGSAHHDHQGHNYGSGPKGGSPVMDFIRDGQSGHSSPAMGGAHSGGRPASRTSGGGGGGAHHDGHHQVKRGGGRGGYHNNHQQHQQQQQHHHQQQQHQQRGGGSQRGFRGGQAGGGSGNNNYNNRGGNNSNMNSNRGRYHQPGRPSANKKDTLKFDSEYDFEQANEEFKELVQQFQKSSLEDKENKEGSVTGAADSSSAAAEESAAAPAEGGGGESASAAEVGSTDDGDDAVYYDKSKSFFDSISCEAMERSKGMVNRTDWKKEKKLNKETFGVAGNMAMGRRNFFHHNQNRGHGHGPYNNHRSNNYGNNYNNRGYGYNNGYGGYSRGGGGGQQRGGQRGWNNGGQMNKRGGPRGGGMGGNNYQQQQHQQQRTGKAWVDVVEN